MFRPPRHTGGWTVPLASGQRVVAAAGHLQPFAAKGCALVSEKPPDPSIASAPTSAPSSVHGNFASELSDCDSFLQMLTEDDQAQQAQPVSVAVGGTGAQPTSSLTHAAVQQHESDITKLRPALQRREQLRKRLLQRAELHAASDDDQPLATLMKASSTNTFPVAKKAKLERTVVPCLAQKKVLIEHKQPTFPCLAEKKVLSDEAKSVGHGFGFKFSAASVPKEFQPEMFPPTRDQWEEDIQSLTESWRKPCVDRGLARVCRSDSLFAGLRTEKNGYKASSHRHMIISF